MVYHYKYQCVKENAEKAARDASIAFDSQDDDQKFGLLASSLNEAIDATDGEKAELYKDFTQSTKELREEAGTILHAIWQY